MLQVCQSFSCSVHKERLSCLEKYAMSPHLPHACMQARVKLGWRISKTLILDAGEASLDDNYSDLKEKGISGRLADYAALMAKRPEVRVGMR